VEREKVGGFSAIANRPGSHYFRRMEVKARLEDWLSLRPALVHIYEGAVAPTGRDARIPAGGNHFAWLLEKGSVTVVQNGRTVTANEGQWLIAYPGERYQKFSHRARIISMHFQIKWPDGCNLFEEGLSLVLTASDYPRLEHEARLLLETVRGVLPPDPVKIRETPLSVEQYLMMQHRGSGFLAVLAGALIREGLIPSRVGQTDERLLDALRQLDSWPVNQPLEKNLATRAGAISRNHLARRFQKAFGVTPGQYYENRRRDYARRLLGHSAVPVKEIAGNLGFRSLADFSSWFKRAHRVSPRAYRKSIMDAGYL